jgi:hypothetical protein
VTPLVTAAVPLAAVAHPGWNAPAPAHRVEDKFVVSR